MNRRLHWLALAPLLASLALPTMLLLPASPTAAQEEGAKEVEDDWGVGEESLVLGKYRKAILEYRAALATAPDSLGDRYGLALTLLETGAYEEAGKWAASLLKTRPDAARFRLLAGRIAMRRGRWDEAETVFRAVIKSAPKSFEAHARLGRLLMVRGEHEKANEYFRVPERIAAEERVTDAERLLHLGWCYQGLGRLPDAAEKYVAAGREDPELYDAHVSLIRAYLEYNQVFAARGGRLSYVGPRDDALRNNPHQPDVHLAMADVYVVRTEMRKARESLKKALASNPNLVHGLCLEAFFAIDRMDFKRADKFLDQADDVRPGDKEVESYRAALAYIRGDKKTAEAKWRAVLAKDKTYAETYYILAELLNNLRRYHEAYTFAKRAIEVRPTMWAAWDSYARYSLHTAREEEALKALKHAARNDPGQEIPWRTNMLLWFSHLDEFIVHKWGPFELRLHADDNPVLKRYIKDALDESYRKLTKKYGFEPKTPIRVAVFSKPKDFSVRTVGVPGIFGVLGACFGQVITMNSPRALPQLPYVWKATLWHEFAHVITLQMSDYRVSRWLTEGLSVYEEKCQNPAWEDPQDHELYNALKNGELAPIKELDGYFRSAKISFAYLQSLHLVEFIIAEHGGFQKLLAMLGSYAKGLDTEGVLRDVLGLTAEKFDRDFESYVARRFAEQRIQIVRSREAYEKARETLDLDPKDVDSLRVVAWYHFQRGEEGVVDCEAALGRLLRAKADDASGIALRGELALRGGKAARARRFFDRARGLGWDEFYLRLNLARMALSDGQTDAAIGHYKAAKRLFPRYAGAANPYLALAELYGKAGDRDAARAELVAFAALQATDAASRLKLAKHYGDIGDHETAERYLREVIQVTPFEVGPHRQLADTLAKRKKYDEALDELSLAILLLEESDSPDAVKQLVPDVRLARARILRKMGNEAAAIAEAKAALKAHPGHEGLQAFLRG